MAVVELLVQLRPISCHSCGATYALNERYAREQQEYPKSDQGWHCPYCQASSWYGPGELQRTQQALARMTSRADQLQARAIEAEKREKRAKAETKRLKKRAAAGVCPCCHRSFVELQKHMTSKHPEFVAAQETT